MRIQLIVACGVVVLGLASLGHGQQVGALLQVDRGSNPDYVSKNPLLFTRFSLSRTTRSVAQQNAIVALDVKIKVLETGDEAARGRAEVAVQFEAARELNGKNPAHFAQKIGPSDVGGVFGNLVIEEELNGYAIVITPYFNLREQGFEAFVVYLDSGTTVDAGIPFSGDVAVRTERFVARPVGLAK